MEIAKRGAGTTRVRVLSPKESKPTGALLWIHGGGLIRTLDLFLEESRAYAKRLIDAGGVCHFDEIPGAFHGFDAIAPNASVSQAFLKRQTSYLRECLNLPLA